MNSARKFLSLILSAILLCAAGSTVLAAPAPAELSSANAAAAEETFIIEGIGALDDIVPITVSERERALAGQLPDDFDSAYYWDYMRAQLDADSKLVYDIILKSAWSQGPTTEKLEIPLPFTDMDYAADIFQSAVAALLMDHVELSWLVNVELSTGGFFGTDSFNVGITEDGYKMATMNPEKVPADKDPYAYADTKNLETLNAALAKAKNEIGTLNGKTRYEKAKAIYEWICKHTEYADEGSEKFLNDWRGYQTVYSAMVDGVTVCAGYAKAMKLLCNAYEVPCVYVTGFSMGEPHAWNYMQMDDGKWYGVDSTWGDQPYQINYRDYFLKGSSTFTDHTEGTYHELPFRYPALSESDYNPQGAQGTPPPIVSTQPLPASQPTAKPTAENPAVRPGDVNLDGTVNLADILTAACILNGTRPLTEAVLLNADFNQNGRMDVEDLLEVAALVRHLYPTQTAAPGTADVLTVTGPSGTVSEGETVTITVSGTGQPAAGRLRTTGLEFVSVSSALSDKDTFVLLPDFGTSAVTYIYRVSAASGEVSFTAEKCSQASENAVWGIRNAGWTGRVQASSAEPTAKPTADSKPTPGLPDDPLTEFFQSQGDNCVFYYTETPAAQVLKDMDKAVADVKRDLDERTTEKVQVYIYPDLLTYHTAMGDPAGPDWWIVNIEGNAIHMVSPANPGSAHTYSSVLDGLKKEYTELVIWGINPGTPDYLLTGVTEYESNLMQYVGYAWLEDAVQQHRVPSLKDIPVLAAKGYSEAETTLFEVLYVDFILQTYGPAQLRKVIAGAGLAQAAGMNEEGLEAAWSRFVTAKVPQAEGPAPVPAPEIPEVEGYQGGSINGKTYYAKAAGFSSMFYLKSSSGRIARVSAPYTTDSDGVRFYPVNHGGTLLYPRVTDGKISAYCVYADGMEIPMLRVNTQNLVPATTDGYQVGTINGKTFYVKVSGASIMFYLKSSSGRMARVSAPYITDSNGVRYYPLNHGGTVLFPQLSNGQIASYNLPGENGDVIALLVM